VALCGAGCTRRASDAAAPNLVVIVVDTLRADRVHCYGAERDTSPVMDRIAAEGVLFEQTFTVAPSTWQSFVSILTGLNPPRHGVRFIFDAPLAPEVPSLGSTLGRHGYATVSFDVIGFVRGMTGGRGFDAYVDNQSLKNPGVVPDAELTDHILSWLAARSQTRPFFIFVRYQGAHWKYLPKPEFHDLFGTDDGVAHSFNEGDYGLGLVPGADGVGRLRLTDPEAGKRLTFRPDMSPRERDHMILHYDAAVRTVDEQIGRIVERLRATGVLDTTLFVVTSDHGESFGERGYLQHGPQVDEAVMHVPLIMRFPPGTHGRPGQRVTQLVRTIDLMPTALAALGIPLPDGLQGNSLLPAIDNGAPLDLIAYGESAGEFVKVDAQTYAPGVGARQRMLRTARWKLVHARDENAGTYRLHDMAARGEDEDVAGAHPDVLADMRASLEAIIASDYRSANPSHTPRVLTDAQRERLRALGYL
jgi:arylsulfatase A-like enzyme